jgi:hypothetical protein
MQLKILYTAILILCVSALASSHECSRHSGGQSGERVKVAVPDKDKGALTIEKEEPMEFSLLRALYV